MGAAKKHSQLGLVRKCFGNPLVPWERALRRFKQSMNLARSTQPMFAQHAIEIIWRATAMRGVDTIPSGFFVRYVTKYPKLKDSSFFSLGSPAGAGLHMTSPAASGYISARTSGSMFPWALGVPFPVRQSLRRCGLATRLPVPAPALNADRPPKRQPILL